LPQQSDEQQSSVHPVVLQVPAWQQAASPEQQLSPFAQQLVLLEQHDPPTLGSPDTGLLVMV